MCRSSRPKQDPEVFPSERILKAWMAETAKLLSSEMRSASI